MDDHSNDAEIAVATGSDDDSQPHSMPCAVQISIHSLPNETVMNIFRFLTRRDLNAVRLVQRAWTNHSAAALFDQVYISPHTEDLDVLMNLSRHPVYSTMPKKAIYLTDIWENNIGDLTYINNLVIQVMHRFCPPYRCEKFQYADEELKTIYEYAVASTEDFVYMDPNLIKLKGLRIIEEGMVAYRERAARKSRDWANRQRTVERINAAVKGLRNLNTIEFVNFVAGYGFPREAQDVRAQKLYRASGSPMARTWHLFYLQPEGYKTDVHTQFFTMIEALAQGPQQVRRLATRMMSPGLFSPSSQVEYPTDLHHCINALQYLEVLHLRMHPRLTEKSDILQNLPCMLRSMTRLRELELDLGSLRMLIVQQRLPLHSMHEVFGTNFEGFPNLERLALRWLKGSAAEVMEFLGNCTRLNSLEMEGIELTEGRWVDVTDFLVTTLYLPRVVFVRRLRQPGNIGVWITGVGEGHDRFFKVEEHTCTTFDEDPHVDLDANGNGNSNGNGNGNGNGNYSVP